MNTVPNDQHSVKIRLYESKDYIECREIFSEGMQGLVIPIVKLILSKFLRIAVLSIVLLVAVSAIWWSWIMLLVYGAVCIVFPSMVYVYVYIETIKFVNSCLTTDLADIEKSYMFSKGCCMWVAEYSGRVVGMVGLIHNDSHEDRVAELQRMSVSSTVRRKGIAGKLIRELIQFAREQNYKKIELVTSNAQKAAIALYKKIGFKLVNVFPFTENVLLGGMYAHKFEYELQ